MILRVYQMLSLVLGSLMLVLLVIADFAQREEYRWGYDAGELHAVAQSWNSACGQLTKK